MKSIMVNDNTQERIKSIKVALNLKNYENALIYLLDLYDKMNEVKEQ